MLLPSFSLHPSTAFWHSSSFFVSTFVPTPCLFVSHYSYWTTPFQRLFLNPLPVSLYNGVQNSSFHPCVDRRCSHRSIWPVWQSVWSVWPTRVYLQQLRYYNQCVVSLQSWLLQLNPLFCFLAYTVSQDTGAFILAIYNRLATVKLTRRLTITKQVVTCPLRLRTCESPIVSAGSPFGRELGSLTAGKTSCSEWPGERSSLVSLKKKRAYLTSYIRKQTCLTSELGITLMIGHALTLYKQGRLR